MVTLKIDGQRVEAEEGKTVLDVANDLGIEIPTICHHRAIPPVGACHICIVEVKAGARPVVDEEACVGCGNCERACIHLPQAIRVTPAAMKQADA